MNRHGLKLRLKLTNDQLKAGEKVLGSLKFNKLKRRKKMYFREKEWGILTELILHFPTSP